MSAHRAFALQERTVRLGSGLRRWLAMHRGAVSMAGMLAFAGPIVFFVGALSVATEGSLPGLAHLAGWWLLYGAVLWGLLLCVASTYAAAARRAGERTALSAGVVAAAVAAAGTNLLTAGRTAALVEQGLAHTAATAQWHAFTFSLVMALSYLAHLRRSRSHAAAAARLSAAQAGQRRARGRIIQSRLQEVQARIDPQALFDLLGTVRDLYAREPPRAERFLDELVAFLRAALPGARSHASSLLREAELAAAFVRLRALASDVAPALTLAVAPEAMHARFPAGILLPLLETAGGCGGPCRLTATRHGLVLVVHLALAGPPSAAAIERVRGLLAVVHGSAAALETGGADPARELTIEVPYELA